MFEQVGTISAAERQERGASGVEYGLAVAAIAGLIVVGAFLLGSSVSGMFSGVDELLGQFFS